MTPAELEAISRAAAAKLPNEQWRGRLCGPEAAPTGAIWKGSGAEWLHESTEACAEIMVRVLWPAGWHIDGSYHVTDDAHVHALNRFGLSKVKETNADPMLAFRVAVLSAVVML